MRRREPTSKEVPMKKVIAAGLCAAAFLTAAPVASASPSLSKTQGRTQIKKFVRGVFYRLDDAESYSVESTYKCVRLRRNKVICGARFETVSDSGRTIYCDQDYTALKTWSGYVKV